VRWTCPLSRTEEGLSQQAPAVQSHADLDAMPTAGTSRAKSDIGRPSVPPGAVQWEGLACSDRKQQLNSPRRTPDATRQRCRNRCRAPVIGANRDPGCAGRWSKPNGLVLHGGVLPQAMRSDSPKSRRRVRATRAAGAFSPNDRFVVLSRRRRRETMRTAAARTDIFNRRSSSPIFRSW